jgi:hypothetical protein
MSSRRRNYRRNRDRRIRVRDVRHDPPDQVRLSRALLAHAKAIAAAQAETDARAQAVRPGNPQHAAAPDVRSDR